MQQTIIAENEDYVSALNCIRQALGDDQGDLSEQISIDEAYALSQKVAQAVGKKCQCDRWKQLYQQESVHSAKLVNENDALLKKIAVK